MYEDLSYRSPSRLHSFLHSHRTSRSDWLSLDNAHFCTGSRHRTILCLQDRFEFLVATKINWKQVLKPYN